MNISATTAELSPLAAGLLAVWPADRWQDVHVLVGVSGGADSMALLRAAVESKPPGAGRLAAGHVNHQLRGAASEADEAWLQDECQRLGVDFFVRRDEETAAAAKQGRGVEEAARRARRRLLLEMAEQFGARYVALAHTQDDQAETALFRILRGAGLRGLAAMRPFCPLGPNVTLVRPLLAVSRSDIEEYLQTIGQAYREDATNAETRFTRNWIRRELLPPAAERFGSSVPTALASLAEQAAEAQDFIEQQARAVLESARSDAGQSTARTIRLAIAPLTSAPPLLVRETLRLAWRDAGWPEQAMTRSWWRQLAALCRPELTSDALNLPSDISARRSGKFLELSR